MDGRDEAVDKPGAVARRVDVGLKTHPKLRRSDGSRRGASAFKSQQRSISARTPEFIDTLGRSVYGEPGGMDLKDRVVRSVHHQMGELDRPNSGKYAAIVRLEYTDGVVEHYETAKTSFRGIRGR